MRGIWFKTGVLFTLDHIRNPHIWRILEVSLETAPATVDGLVVVTSAADGAHSEFSLHYPEMGSLALDIRIKNISAAAVSERDIIASKWVDAMRKKLGDDYDVVLESDHIHVEYDPE